MESNLAERESGSLSEVEVSDFNLRNPFDKLRDPWAKAFAP